MMNAMKPKLLLGLALVLCGESAIAYADETSAINAEAATNSMKAISAKVEAGYSNFIPAVSNIMGTNYGPVAAKAMAGLETNVLTALTNSAMLELGEAAKFFLELKKRGNLPGVSTDSHGEVTADNLPLSELQTARYPFTVTFNVILGSDSFTNHYTVFRPAMNAAWQLKKAWRTDTQGHMVNEWPIK